MQQQKEGGPRLNSLLRSALRGALLQVSDLRSVAVVMSMEGEHLDEHTAPVFKLAKTIQDNWDSES